MTAQAPGWGGTRKGSRFADQQLTFRLGVKLAPADAERVARAAARARIRIGVWIRAAVRAQLDREER